MTTLLSSANFSIESPCMFVDKKNKFASVAQYVAYEKVKMTDTTLARKVLISKHVDEINAIAKQVPDSDLWNVRHKDVLYIGNVLKFTQNEHLREELLATGDDIIAFAVPYDPVYNIGSVIRRSITYPHGWTGQNMLGESLMDVRAMLRHMA